MLRYTTGAGGLFSKAVVAGSYSDWTAQTVILIVWVGGLFERHCEPVLLWTAINPDIKCVNYSYIHAYIHTYRTNESINYALGYPPKNRIRINPNPGNIIDRQEQSGKSRYRQPEGRLSPCFLRIAVLNQSWFPVLMAGIVAKRSLEKPDPGRFLAGGTSKSCLCQCCCLCFCFCFCEHLQLDSW
jgi:hypothetical protein